MKKWYASKTLWVNTLSVIAIVLQGVYKKEVFPLEYQAVALAIINSALRAITKEPINW